VTGLAVLSVSQGLTVWCWGGRIFRWREGDSTLTWPAGDVRGAAAWLAAAAARARPPSAAGRA
jgi:hypothetical protein